VQRVTVSLLATRCLVWMWIFKKKGGYVMYSSKDLPPNCVREKYLLGVGAFKLSFAKGKGDLSCPRDFM
jgi:hypothetical protein